MKANNLCKGILHSKVAMSLLVALISATTVSAQSTAKTKVADSTKVKTAKTVVKDVKKKKDVKNVQRTNNKWILNNKQKGNTTTGTGAPTEFQDGDDLWLRIRDGHKFQQRPTESGIYLHQGKKIAIQ